MPVKNYEKIGGIVAKITVAFIIAVSLILLFIERKPFEVDEWRLIYNLKFKDSTALWGQLDFVQQFPRVYLQLVKAFTQPLHYSYFSLRLPSFLIGTSAIVLCWRLMLKLFPAGAARFLFVLLMVSSYTFMEYYIEVKQYTMDILLSLVAIWQLLQLLTLVQGKRLAPVRYVALCATLLTAPFFSYTYPIVIVPVFVVVPLQSLLVLKSYKGAALLKVWLPLVGCIASLATFYMIDAAQVNKDPGMQQYWHYLMMKDGFSPMFFLKGSYLLFAQMGVGDLFEVILGVMGIGAFVFAISDYVKSADKNDMPRQVRLYSLLLVSFTLLLFAAGKLPIGAPRLNSFTIASIAILIVWMLQQLYEMNKRRAVTGIIVVLLYAGTVGQIFSATVNTYTSSDGQKKYAIYKNTSEAIKQAQAKKMPILITSEVAFPSQKMICYPHTNEVAYTMCWPPTHEQSVHFNAIDDMPGDWVVKTLPAYDVNDPLPVYAIGSLPNADDYINRLPANVKWVLAGDGVTFKKVMRK